MKKSICQKKTQKWLTNTWNGKFNITTLKKMQIKITVCYFTLARKVYYKKCMINNTKG